MNDWEKQRVLAEARATVDRLRNMPAPTPRDPLAEDALEKWERLKDASQEPPPAPERRKLDTFPVARVHEIVAEAIEAERESVMEMLADIVNGIRAVILETEDLGTNLRAEIDEEITKAVKLLSRDLRGIATAVRERSALPPSTDNNITPLRQGFPSRPGVRRRA